MNYGASSSDYSSYPGYETGYDVPSWVPNPYDWGKKLYDAAQSASSSGSHWGPLGSAPQDASVAAKAATAAANDLKKSVAVLHTQATATLDTANEAAKKHGEMADTVKYAIIAVGILGAAAVIYYVVK
jgi:hypothetical protein